MLILRNIARVLTLGGTPGPRRGSYLRELGEIRDGAVVIRDDRIAWVGRSADLPVPPGAPDARVVDGAGRALLAMPGFVDAHTHPIFGGTRADEYEARALGRTYQEIAAAGGGIQASVRQLRARSTAELAGCAEPYFARFLSHGTTTIEAKSGYGLTVDDELRSLEALEALRSRSPLQTVPTLLGAHAIPDEHRDRRRDYVRAIVEEMIPRAAARGLARYCDVFCDTGYFSVDEAREVLGAARTAGLGLRIHAAQLGPGGGARLAAELRVASADHLEWIRRQEVEMLAGAGTVATLLPGVPFNLGLDRYAPARALVAAGVPVALASDFNPGTCFTLNMQLVLSIACSRMGLAPAEAIAAATINGACALGLGDVLGSLEPGKQADVVLMDVADYRELPYFFGVNHCVLTVKRGTVVYDRLEVP